MKREIFILIVTIYGFLLAASMLFLPGEAVKYFGGDSDDFNQLGLMQNIGMVHLAFNFIGFKIRKSADNQAIKAYLVAVMIATFGGIILALYNVFGRNLPLHDTAFLDWGLWAILGIGAFYYWNKTK